MNRNRNPNSIFVYLPYVVVSLLFLHLGPVCAHPFEDPHAESYTGRYFGYYKDGFFTGYPIHLIADKDNTSSEEDIIFGFDGGGDSYKERMRLTDEGLLGIGIDRPEALLDLRRRLSTDVEATFMGKPVIVVQESEREDVGFFGLTHSLITDVDGFLDIGLDVAHGLAVSVKGGSEWRHDAATVSGTTSVGFDLVIPGLSTGEENGQSVTAADFRSRALTMEMGKNWDDSLAVRLGVGYGHDHELDTWARLDVNGAVRIGDVQPGAVEGGTIRFVDGAFQGHNGSAWLSFGTGHFSNLLGQDDSIDGLALNHIVFGNNSNNNADNYIVSSLSSPPDPHSEHFPIPEDSPNSPNHNYRHDDNGTSGGITVVTNGDPRFTVKGNGNTYVHRRLSIGIGGYVEDSALTVAGSVHIGPDTLQPSRFSYGNRLANYLLWVEHGIVSEDFAVANVTDWNDHVFAEDYELKSLSEVESFIEQEGHLPGVPSEEEVKENGYTVHEMTRALLEKVEELTLHTIAQQKVLEAQRDEISKLHAQVADMGKVSDKKTFVRTGF